MTGDYELVIGMEKDEPLWRFTRRIASGRFEPALGPRPSAPSRSISGRRASPRRLRRCGLAACSAPPGRTSGRKSTMTAPTIVYDLDETLADTAGDLMGALNAVLIHEGSRRYRWENARSMLGAGGRALIQRGFAASGAELVSGKARSLCSATSSPITMPISQITPSFIPALKQPLRPSRATAGARPSAPTRWRVRRGFSSRRWASQTGSPSFAARTRSGSASRTRSLCSEPSPPRAGSRPRRHGRRFGHRHQDGSRRRPAGDRGRLRLYRRARDRVGPDRVISHFDELAAACAALMAK